MGDARSDIIELSDYVYQRARNRLAGLTDDEYFWEPVPGCCTIRRANSGEYRADDASEPDPPPFTTIAWRLWHLIENYRGKRNPEWHQAPQRREAAAGPYRIRLTVNVRGQAGKA